MFVEYHLNQKAQFGLFFFWETPSITEPACSRVLQKRRLRRLWQGKATSQFNYIVAPFFIFH